jgi:hypothetical protein
LFPLLDASTILLEGSACFRLTTFVLPLQHVVLERGSSAASRHLLLLTSDSSLVTIDASSKDEAANFGAK